MAASLKSKDSLDIISPDVEREPRVPSPPSEPPSKQPPPTSQGVEKPPDDHPGDNLPD